MKQIHDALEEYLKSENVKDFIVEVRNNKDKKNGEFYTNLSFKLSSILKRHPYDIATSINRYIYPKINEYYKTIVSENGYINFYATSNNYKYTLKEIQKMDIEFNIKNLDLTDNNKEIIYMYNRLENIINVLKLERIYIDIEKLNIDNMSKELKAILDKVIDIYEEIKCNKVLYPSTEGLNEIYKMILRYEQINIIRYLDKDELYNFMVISNAINTLIKNTLIN